MPRAVARLGRYTHIPLTQDSPPPLVLFIVVIIVIITTSPVTLRADPAIETNAQAIFSRVMSPYCPGLLLSACPSSSAEDLRNDIRDKLKAGQTPAAIEAGIHQRFGDGTRAAPALRGFGLIAWAVPPVLLGVSGWAFVAWLRRCRGVEVDEVDEAEAPVQASAALRERLDDELADL